MAKGTPPDLYNAVKVFPTGDSEFPSRWQDRAVFTGTLHVTADPKDWPARGVVSLEGAVKGVPGQGPKPGGRPARTCRCPFEFDPAGRLHCRGSPSTYPCGRRTSAGGASGEKGRT